VISCNQITELYKKYLSKTPEGREIVSARRQRAIVRAQYWRDEIEKAKFEGKPTLELTPEEFSGLKQDLMMYEFLQEVENMGFPKPKEGMRSEARIVFDFPIVTYYGEVE